MQKILIASTNQNTMQNHDSDKAIFLKVEVVELKKVSKLINWNGS